MARTAPVDHALPPMKDLTTDNITENVQIINSQCQQPRARYIFDRLVQHLHDFARETRLSSEEWMTGIKFLTEIGQKSTDLRHEMILLSDTLGLSMLVDSIDHPRLGAGTEGTVLGPFHTHDAEETDHGYVLHKDPDATRLLVVCTIKDTSGNPIEGVKIDVWEGDSKGFYDVQREDRDGPDGRAVLRSDKDGVFWFNAIVPVPYPIPDDGPVGAMLRLLGRHPNRPSHVHFMMEKKGFDHLTTALYPRGDPYESSDAVFGVKDSLVVDLGQVTDDQYAKRYDSKVGTKLLNYDFVLVSEADAAELRERKGREAMEALLRDGQLTGSGGQKVKVVNGLPL